ncbi:MULTISPECIES: hypothetical protein [Clostridium]|uniref:hypothetical protein n=1 Tax=Clostridium TaxID=1485 RepID=UPI0002C8E601|nr:MULTISPECIES: hypothetical protein [Clostridium]ETI89176.1 MAG: hypothetical protein Q607_CBUC00182G0156 [Clostridium butyricum DORA_1]APF22978.1 hypothetical protein NPD4_3184 [Clostridium butyricum]EMU53560.1 hypothetical protein CBDKU1_25090 [Clostridium butyricum DKU-01]KIU09132.1 hypothetical protein SC08_Contig83orf03196 [Clostridium butyricum]MBA8965459.1 hypothetical protein [Clostridium butyricum]
MKPDEKYMSEAKLRNTIKFIPPSFNRSLSMDDDINTDYDEETESLDLYPDETDEDQLYCYYNSLGGCNNNQNKKEDLKRNPETFEVLRGLDLDIDEASDLNSNYSENDVNKIYAEIINKNPGINHSFSLYGMPSPIIKVVTKRLIKLSLLYNNKK